MRATLIILHPHRQYPRICLYLLLLGRLGGLIGRIIFPLKASMVNHHALLYSDDTNWVVDIELRSRNYFLIPQTIISFFPGHGQSCVFFLALLSQNCQHFLSCCSSQTGKAKSLPFTLQSAADTSLSSPLWVLNYYRHSQYIHTGPHFYQSIILHRRLF